MSLDSYSNLKAAIASWLARSSDTNITGNAADFITLAESMFNYGYENPEQPMLSVPPLRVPSMENSTTLTPSSGSIGLPTGFVQPIAVYISGDSGSEVEYAPPSWYRRQFPGGQDDPSSYYTIIGSTFYCGSTVAMDYYKILTALADDNTSNFLLAAAPNAYLHGGLMFASIFMKSLDQAQGHRALMLGSLGGYQKATGKFRRAGPLVRRANGPTD